MRQAAELIFVPSPGVGHLLSTVEIAKLLASRDQRLSITILIMKLPCDTGVATFIQSMHKDCNERIAFVELPELDDSTISMLNAKPFLSFLHAFVECQRPHAKNVVDMILEKSGNPLAGFVVDMFCTPMIDVANEFGVPSYAFYTSGAAFLGFAFHAQSLCDDKNRNISEYKDSDVELSIPTFVNPLPSKYLPSAMMTKEGHDPVVSSARRLREVKAILINTFLELETHAIESLKNDVKVPRIYHVGPIINFKSEQKSADAIISWLDKQAPSSVVFLCFGSMGSFEEDQIREMAYGLERSGQPFLWSLRRPPQQKEKMEMPKEYENPEEVLPEGFLERTSGRGKVIGWAPQVTVLSHPAVGGFVTHCGWNSALESIWCGVPMATWPLYAEQHTNAFELVKELGMAVEIKMNYRKDVIPGTKRPEFVTADELESAVRSLMDGESEIKKKAKEMKDASRMATTEGGSSYTSVQQFIEEVINNINNKEI